jgi:hypothetical protein
MASKTSYLNLMDAVYNKAVADASTTIDPTDKVLTNSIAGVLAHLSLNYDNSTGDLQILGKNNSSSVPYVLSTVNLPLDSFLDSVTYNSTTHILTFEWSTTSGKSETEIDLTDLIDTYTAGNGLNLVSGAFSIKLDATSSAKLTVSSSGLKLDDTGYLKSTNAGSGIDISSTNNNISIKLDSTGSAQLTVGSGGLKLDDSTYVKTSGNQSVNGVKTLGSHLVVPSKTTVATNTGTEYATEAQIYKNETDDNQAIADAITDFNV